MAFTMDIDYEVALFDFVFALSEAVDLASPALSKHHRKVAYIAYNIAEEMRLPDETIKNIIFAALLHDIGSFSLVERLWMLNAVIDDIEIGGHAELGYMLLKDFAPMSEVADMIRYHHALYDSSDTAVPLGSYVIHLADRLSVLYDGEHEILGQIPTVMAKLEDLEDKFQPDAFAALKRLSRLEYFWIEAWRYPDEKLLPERMRMNRAASDIDILRGFSKVFARVIDFRSRFTSTHSSGVAAVAKELSILFVFSPRECEMMEIAGFLHDLGKLSVPNEILEKDGKLNRVEFSVIQKHTYYTYMILHKIKGMGQIAEWAAFHHERMDGNGYPFHIKGENLSKLCRIMAVSDVFTAITEDRPYRFGMKKDQTIQILTGMAHNGGLDSETVKMVQDHFEHINSIRHEAQEAALKTYESFFALGSSPDRWVPPHAK